MDYRILETPDAFEQALEVESAIWGVDPRDCVPSSLYRALSHAGGVTHGAYDGDTLVGLALAFPALRDGRLILWSNMTGVLPAYQGQDIGFTLKQVQREWALEQGYAEIGWTFDPLRRGNANFNLHRLGAAASTYLVNFYGEMPDSINAGTPSDRLEAIWRLNEPRVKALALHQPVQIDYPPIQPDNIILADGVFIPAALDAGGATLYAEVPASLTDAAVDAQTWRLALRQALQAAFARGCCATDFIASESRHWYVLRRS